MTAALAVFERNAHQIYLSFDSFDDLFQLVNFLGGHEQPLMLLEDVVGFEKVGGGGFELAAHLGDLNPALDTCFAGKMTDSQQAR